ncbi:sensor histidine kinase [Curvivirga aplysinae]|uniref:sensor histidine kinase n=1 Tax=Curvivirga aplysinae TaxID=2529852 RepID=UPI0012BCA1AE|nr:ATP-binding protein [Curvivirga aplysinae]MTI09914.1 sensor histidine kinase [Curvivirga aplysinae]
MLDFLLQRKVIFRLIALFIAMILLVMVYGVARQIYWTSEFNRASDRTALYTSTLISALERYQHLPHILARDHHVIAGLQQGGAQVLNLRLESFAKQAQVDALYIMNTEGLTIASSNWRESPTFLGKNYGFRPYFKAALEGGRGEFFAIGVTTGTPGYFVGEPIRDLEGVMLGVMAMKVDLSPLTKSWAEGGEKLFVANDDGIVVLSSDESWNYRSIQPLTSEAKEVIRAEKQFVGKALDPLDVQMLGDHELILGQVEYLHQISDIPYLRWQLHYLADKKLVIQGSQTATMIAFIFLSILLAVYLVLRSERIKRELRASEEDSRSLRALNYKLEQQIEERQRAETRLDRAQAELRKTSKMAALGQLAASVSHELGQPISAMQNYLAWADLPDNKMDDETRDVMQRLKRVVGRMGEITKQLKFFARPGGNSLQDVTLQDVISGVKEIMSADIHTADVSLTVDVPEEQVKVRGDRLRLEQVLINLIRNSIDAMRENGGQSIDITLTHEGELAMVNVLDRGPGLPEELADQLFESFVTTKASGEGMGLGLAISASIVEDHGGELKARSRKTGGAEFSMRIPVLLEDQR